MINHKSLSIRLFSVLLLLTLFFAVTGQAVAVDQIKITVDGKVLNFDVPPTTINGRTLVPVRAIFEALGMKVDWDNATQTVIGIKGNTKIELPVDKTFARKNGETLKLDVPATIIGNRTLVPARFVAESLDCYVDWDGITSTVIVSSSPLLKVHFIDVGQGDAIFVDYGDYDILIDAGDNDKGQSVVNYLKQLNTDDLELVIATHPDADHIGGLDDVLKAYKVERIIDSGTVSTTKTYQDYIAAINEEKNFGAEFTYDDNLTIQLGDGISLDIIETGDNNGSNNSNSILARLKYKNTEFLLTGDMDQKVEATLSGIDLSADVLKVGHHGSKTSTSEALLDQVKPKVAVISAGQGNSYGHPHPETLTRLNKYTKNIYGTWNSGNIIITTDGINYYVNSKKVIASEGNQIQPISNLSTTNSSVKIKSIDLEKEIVIIENTSMKEVDLTGWKLVSVTGNQTYLFPTSYIIKAGSSITIASGKATGNLKWTGAYIWNNDGDQGQLYDSSGKMVSNY